MTKATRILNEYHIKELILKGNPQYENFYKEELIEFCKISKHEIDRLNNIINELENIRKETIEYIKDWQSFPHTKCTTHNELKNLLNILSKGSDK